MTFYFLEFVRGKVVSAIDMVTLDYKKAGEMLQVLNRGKDPTESWFNCYKDDEVLKWVSAERLAELLGENDG